MAGIIRDFNFFFNTGVLNHDKEKNNRMNRMVRIMENPSS